MAIVNPRQYKIDKSTSSWYKYGAYRKHRFLGIEVWVEFAKSDYISTVRDYITDDMKLPIMINEEIKK